jgi:hypothetical protein
MFSFRVGVTIANCAWAQTREISSDLSEPGVPEVSN